MSEFTTHTRETAPPSAKPVFDLAEKKFGFIPNLIGVLAESPATAEAYLTLSGLLDKTSLSRVEQQLVLLAVSFENGCDYCVAAHSAGATMTQAPEGVVAALRAGEGLPDLRLDALVRFARRVVRDRGWVADDEVERFLAAGYPRAAVFDVLLAVALKTISNYGNHIAHPELDDALEAFAWRRPARAESTEAA